jgi:hypothetical protein
VTQHRITTTVTGLTGQASSNYTVDPGARTKHLIIVPGEAFATPGKGTARTNVVTGTPTARTKGTSFTASVFATDNYFNRIFTDNSAITLTSNDAAATINPSGATTFSSGTRDFTVTNNTVMGASIAKLTSSGNSITTDSAMYTVNDIAPTNLNYNTNTLTWTRGTASTYSPTNSGGAITTYSASGTWPTGMSSSSLNTSTGVISGTPTAITTATGVSVTITGNNSSGTPTTRTLTLIVNDIPPTAISYPGGPNYTWARGVAISSLTPTLSGNPGPVTYSVSNTGTNKLPSGLTLNTSTGVISGTPSTSEVVGTYTPTISAWNSGNTASPVTVTLNITLNVQPPTGFNYTGNPFTYVVDTSAVSITPSSVTGGTPSSYAVQTGTLPTGLSLNETTGAITGTPSVIGSSTFTIRANNISGFFDRSVTMNVNPKAPSALTYLEGNTQTWTKSSTYSMTPSVADATKGYATSYSITNTGSNRLPTGVTFSTTTGIISGTPSELGAFTPTVTATNVTGSTTRALSITVNDIPPSSLAYSNENATYTLATAITNNTPSSSGGAVVSYSISPSLPQGLTLNTTTGVISGSPRVAFDARSFTVTATNTGGSTTKGITLAVDLPQKTSVIGWWRADDLSPAGSGQPVNTWTSAVGAISFNQNTNPPIYNFTSPRHSLVFSAQAMGIQNDILNGGGNKTIIVAYRTTSFNANNTILSFGNDVSVNNVASSIALTTNGSIITRDQTVTLTTSLTAEGVMSVVFGSGAGQNLSQMSVFHQGSSRTHNGSNTIGINFGSDVSAADFAALGARLDTDGSTLINRFTGSIHEVLVFDTNLSSTERAAVECHLFYKYGMPAMTPACP